MATISEYSVNRFSKAENTICASKVKPCKNGWSHVQIVTIRHVLKVVDSSLFTLLPTQWATHLSVLHGTKNRDYWIWLSMTPSEENQCLTGSGQWP